MSILQFCTPCPEVELRQAIIACGQICYGRHLMSSNDGNISVRSDDEHILITRSGVSKGRMEPDDLLILDLDGHTNTSGQAFKPSSETPMHLEVYRQRPDVRAIIHAHPVFATALSVAGMEFPVDILPEVLLTMEEVPITPYATPSSDEDAAAVRDLILDHNAILLRQHGSLTAGRDLEEALVHLERIEHVAEVFWRAHALGNVNRIPAEALQRLSELRAKYFSA